MAVTGDQVLDVAKSILSSAKTEAEWRTAIGRAYYAIYKQAYDYHVSLPAVGKLPGPYEKSGLHYSLICQLRNPGFSANNKKYSTSTSIGNIMLGLYAARTKADYHLPLDVDADQAKQAITQAEVIFNLINGNPAPPLPTPASIKQGAQVTSSAPRPSLKIIK